MHYRPCSADPDLWFGYADDDASDGAAKARAYEQSALQARAICLRHCPLTQQRDCARLAVESLEEYGVWAGVKLPGGQYRKRHELARAHAVLRGIAEGALDPRDLPESAELLARPEPLPMPVATVVHLPLTGSLQGRPDTAA